MCRYFDVMENLLFAYWNLGVKRSSYTLLNKNTGTWVEVALTLTGVDIIGCVRLARKTADADADLL
jgi:hypothetical protein